MTDGEENPITLLGDTQVFRRIRGEFEDLSRPVAIYLVAVGALALSIALVLVLSGVGVGAPVASSMSQVCYEIDSPEDIPLNKDYTKSP